MHAYQLDGFQIYEYAGNPRKVIFFAHANGIPALTYQSLFSELANNLNMTIISYDMRGIGKTILPAKYAETWGWKVLIDDHVKLFHRIKKTFPKHTEFFLCGHSVGSWISLLSTKYIGVYPLILCEPPILRGVSAFAWYFMQLANKRDKNPKSKKVLKRRTHFISFAQAQNTLKKNSFFSKWKGETLKNYILGSFKENDETKELSLRHHPQWEAHIFEQYPPTASAGFMELPKSLRRELKPIFLIGEQSDTCHPAEKRLVTFFFPKAHWVVIPNAGHMFPLENSQLTIETLKNLKKYFD